MALTLTWTTGPYRYELAGKQFIDQVEYRIKAVDGDKEDDSYFGTVSLDRPDDVDMEARSSFATQAKLLAAVKAKLGVDTIAAAEDSATLVLQAKTHSTATAES